MARVASLAQAITVATGHLVGPEARKAAVVAAARSAFARADAQNARILGHAVPHTTLVDGVAGAREDAVKVGGTIVYLWGVGAGALENAVDQAYRLLLEHSPVLTGAYRASHVMLVDGQQRQPPVRLSDASVVQFVSLLPYARRIERGWSAQAPDGVYEEVATLLRQTWGRLLTIQFEYEGFRGADEHGVPRRRASKKARNASANRYPSIRLQLK